MVITVVGPVDHDEIVARVDTALAVVGEGERPSSGSTAAEIVPEVVTPRSIEQMHLAQGWRTGGLHSPDRYALAVATQVLGGGWSVACSKEVREKRA